VRQPALFGTQTDHRDSLRAALLTTENAKRQILPVAV